MAMASDHVRLIPVRHHTLLEENKPGLPDEDTHLVATANLAICISDNQFAYLDG